VLIGLGMLAGDPSPSPAQSQQAFTAARLQLVEKDVAGAGVKNPRVLRSMRDTPRHEFMPRAQWPHAYDDRALPIGYAQTISPPFIVAFMTEQLDPQPTDRVLEIGTGSGYQAAVLSPLVKEVYTIEIVEPLGKKAASTLRRLKYENVHVKVGDGYEGWPEHAPFDKIIVTCSPEKVPPKLVAQLREGGRMVVPVGERYQQTLYLLKKVEGKMETEDLKPTLFVPMTGKAEELRQVQPDPARPGIRNGDFEDTAGDPPELAVWHYQRQLQVVSDSTAPSGTHYVRFTNEVPGRYSQALQGTPCDGQRVKQLRISAWVQAKDIRPGDRASAQVTFYDRNRATVGRDGLGPWQGSFAWRQESKTIAVPPRAREAVVFIGLDGATGELALDALKIQRVDK
jgi:protein-L-isoaspartate(D-aspartate) O-methyltransferase